MKKLRHIGAGRRFMGEDVVLLLADADVRITNLDGDLLSTLPLDPVKDHHLHSVGWVSTMS